jgi:hypothetical protein
MAQRDVAAGRVRAFVLALTGDTNGAMVAADAAMPGSWARVAPFLQRLPSLQAGQKAAAVNLGLFPDSNDTAYAYNAAPVRNYSASSATVTASVSTDRLAAVDELLRQPAPTVQPSWRSTPAAAQPSWQATPRPTQIAYSAPVSRQQLAPQTSPQFAPQKIWLQLASGSNEAALPSQFERIRSRDRDLFNGITGYVARSPNRVRLVIGPFHSASDADTFAADLETMSVNAFKWSNSPSDEIVPLGTE